MNYNEIKNLIFERNNISWLDAEICSCVSASLHPVKVRDNSYNLLCSFTKTIWNHLDYPNTQILADIVVDLFNGCIGSYRRGKSFKADDGSKIKRRLTLKDLEEQDYRVRDMVMDIYGTKISWCY